MEEYATEHEFFRWWWEGLTDEERIELADKFESEKKKHLEPSFGVINT